MMRADIKPVDVIPTGSKLPDYALPERSMEYLDKMRTLCEANGIELILIKAPTIWPYWYPEWDEQIAEYAGQYGIDYYNLLHDDILLETGIDYSTDTADAGLHMNVFGAEKLSSWIGGKLKSHYVLTDHRSETNIIHYWDSLSEAYDEMKAKQIAELETVGKIQSHIWVLK